MSVAELHTALQGTIDEIQSDIDAYDERVAIRQASFEAPMSSTSTTDYAIQALKELETPWGKHSVARAWLRNYEPHVRVFVRVAE